MKVELPETPNPDCTYCDGTGTVCNWCEYALDRCTCEHMEWGKGGNPGICLMCVVKDQEITTEQREKATALLLNYVEQMKAWHARWEAFHDDMCRQFPTSDTSDDFERYWDGLHEYAESITHGRTTFDQKQFETHLRRDRVSHGLGGSRWELSRQQPDQREDIS